MAQALLYPVGMGIGAVIGFVVGTGVVLRLMGIGQTWAAVILAGIGYVTSVPLDCFLSGKDFQELSKNTGRRCQTLQPYS